MPRSDSETVRGALSGADQPLGLIERKDERLGYVLLIVHCASRNRRPQNGRFSEEHFSTLDFVGFLGR